MAIFFATKFLNLRLLGRAVLDPTFSYRICYNGSVPTLHKVSTMHIPVLYLTKALCHILKREVHLRKLCF